METISRPLREGVLFDGTQENYPSRLLGFTGGLLSHPDPSQHGFIFCLDGAPSIHVAQGSFVLRAGMYASAPGPYEISGEGRAVVFQRLGYRGLFSVGGPAEDRGRLAYIDNCSTTLLAPPARNGDPCLNALYFPPETDQSVHFHPTLRLGLVLRGSGWCKRPGRPELTLSVGETFALPAGMLHGFRAGAAGLTVIAYHPDSDGGPTDQSHPMLNRTYLERP